MKRSLTKTEGLLAVGVLLLAAAGGVAFDRAWIRLDGTIISSQTSCNEHLRNPCTTFYVIEDTNRKRVSYQATGGDSSLSRRLPAGTQIVKHRWKLNYWVNDQEVRDFPVKFYSMFSIVGLVCLVIYNISKNST